jgi:hypothetical protein
MANTHVIKAIALLPCPLIPKSQDNNLESGTAAIAPRAVQYRDAQLKTFVDPASLFKSGHPVRLMSVDKFKPTGEVAPSKSNATGG